MGTHSNINTRRAEINNEVVLLRKLVRQARVCVSRKLLRDAKLLRAKRGDEKRCERNGNKASRLINEVLTLKRIKDDDVSFFGILNSKSLQSILQDPMSDERTRILAKVTHYKNLYKKIMEFRKKYPDFENNCKSLKKKRNAKKCVSAVPEKTDITMKVLGKDIYIEETKHETVCVNRNEPKNGKDGINDQGVHNDGHSDEDDNDHNDVGCCEIANERQNKHSMSTKRSADRKNTIRPMAKSGISMQRKNDECTNFMDAEASVKTVSDIATVKRFAKLLESEESSVKGTNWKEMSKRTDLVNANTTENMKKESDDFFITSNGSRAYLSIVVSKPDKNLQNMDVHSMGINKQVKMKNVSWNSNGEKLNFTRGKRRMCSRVVEVAKQERNVLRDNVGKRKEMHPSDKELHPSWEAKRKQQEIMNQGFQGKKIIFDNI